MAKQSTKKQEAHEVQEKDRLNREINPHTPIERIEDALSKIDILNRVPNNLKNDAWVSLLRHYENVIVKNLQRAEE